MNIIAFLVGLVLLLFGRRLFWFFVAAAGFAAGIYLARDHFQVQSQMLVLAIALLAGIVGAIISLLMQKIAIAVAGFAAGGYLGATLLESLHTPNFAWVGFLAGGIIGSILLLIVFDWALIALSALMGAALVSEAFTGENTSLLVFVAAFLVGLAVQALDLRRVREIERPAPAAPAPPA